MVIREVVKDDRQAWSVLWSGYNAFYGRVGPTSVPQDVSDVTWERFLDPSEPMFAVVAERDGRLVGLVHYLFHRNTLMVQRTCYLQDLFTCPDARGEGVGRALIQAVYDRAGAAGCARVYWHTQETNQTARHLYDRLADRPGFVVYRHDLS